MLRPRLTVRELRREENLTGRCCIVVEGASDLSFMKGWLIKKGLSHVAFPENISSIEIDDSHVSDLGLIIGNRGRVIALAKILENAGERRIKCVADRDLGDGLEQFNFSTLLWTDYPAVESYGACEKVINYVNAVHCKEVLPVGESFFAALWNVLTLLFRERMARGPGAPNPKWEAAASTGDLRSFSLERAFPGYECATSAGVGGTISLCGSGSPEYRPTVYGHDLGQVIFNTYKAKIKNTAKIARLEDFEARIRESILALDICDSENLFVSLAGWVEDVSPGVQDM